MGASEPWEVKRGKDARRLQGTGSKECESQNENRAGGEMKYHQACLDWGWAESSVLLL